LQEKKYWGITNEENFHSFYGNYSIYYKEILLIQQLYRKMRRLYFLLVFVFFCLMGCPFVPNTTTTADSFLVVGEELGCAFRVSYKNCAGGAWIEDSLGNLHYSEDVLLVSPFEFYVGNDFETTKYLRDYNNTGIKLHGFKKGDKLRAIVMESGKTLMI